MSEEQKQEQVQETSTPVEAKEETKQETKTEAEQRLFNQQQLDNIVQARVMAERKKYEKKIPLFLLFF